MNEIQQHKYQYIDVDVSNKIVCVTMNVPDKRNALSIAHMEELTHCFKIIGSDKSLSVIILKGNGPSFCAGHDLKELVGKSLSFYNKVFEVCTNMMNTIQKIPQPVIAQVHGYCLAGGTELAQSCDLVYVADNAKIGYPVVRNISPPDNQFFPWIVGMRKAMELMLTGNSMSGYDAVECGFANLSFPEEKLEEEVLKIAENVAKVPQDVQQINKRAVHRQMEMMGIRSALRAGTELQQLSMHTKSARDFFKMVAEEGLTNALSDRDTKYGDYRETNDKKKD